MTFSLAGKALEFFLPRLPKQFHIVFYGGEPLLEFPLLKDIISYIERNKQEKTAHYSLTTNGSLLTEEILEYFDQYHFFIELSFDGHAQEIHRQKKSFHKILGLIEQILQHSHIRLEVNSVFTPESIDLLSDSVKLLIDRGVSQINLSLSILKPWSRNFLRIYYRELMKVKKILVPHFHKNKTIPVLNFTDHLGQGVFTCAAGKDRLVITPEGDIWGCSLFPEYFRGKEKTPEFQDYYFGRLSDFIRNQAQSFSQISINHSELNCNRYSTSKQRCFLCSHIRDCEICPISAAFVTQEIKKIPDYMCRLQKIKIHVKKLFKQEIST